MEMELLCKSLRFEDRKPCLCKSQDSSRFCKHHGEIAVCLSIVNNCVDDYIYKRQLLLTTPEDINAVNEVENYMRNFLKSIMYGNYESDTFWWMEKHEKKSRQRGYCKSLELSDGTLCTEAVGHGAEYCRYHFVQHQILCEAYHLTRMNMEPFGISQQTLQFTEFMLRREFSKIFIVQDNFGHQIRFATLFDGMFDYPYPQENFIAIDKEFYADAQKYSGAAERMFRSSVASHVKIYYDDFDENGDEIEYDYYEASPEPKQVAVTYKSDEDWDKEDLIDQNGNDIECDNYMAPRAPKRKAQSYESNEDWDEDDNEHDYYMIPPVPKRVTMSHD